MANPASNSAAVQFSNLLKQSKALHLSPDTVITSQAGYLHRNDYGLKRPLPASLSKTPYVKVRQMDSKHSQTDFVSAGKESLFIKRWDEANLGVSMPPGKDANQYFIKSSPFDASKPLRNPIQPLTQDLPEASTSAQPATGGPAPESALGVQAGGANSQVRKHELEAIGALPEFENMTEPEFTSFLGELRQLRPQYIQFIKQIQHKSLTEDVKKATPAKQQEAQAKLEAYSKQPMNLYEYSVTSRAETGQHMVDFLRSPVGSQALSNMHRKKANRLRDAQHGELKATVSSDLHTSGGLSYTFTDRLYNEYFATPLPARILHASNRSKVDGYSGDDDKHQPPGLNTTVFGLGSRVNINESIGKGVTQFHPNDDGSRSQSQGRGLARITSAVFREYLPLDGSDDMHKKIYPWEVDPDKTSSGLPIVPELQLVFEPNKTEAELKRSVPVVPGSKRWIYHRSGQAERDVSARQKQEVRSSLFDQIGLFPKRRHVSKKELKARERAMAPQMKRMQSEEEDDLVGYI